jgi:hypothetical protein
MSLEKDITNLKESFSKINESRYSRHAQTDEQEELITQLEQTLSQLGKRIVGVITIGKFPQTVILDLTYNGAEIYVNASNPDRDRKASVKINNVEVDPSDVESVKSAITSKGETDESS